MDAAADYADARRALRAPRPAYVSYHVRSHAGFDAIKGDESSTVVVRTRDGKVVSGKRPAMHVSSDGATIGANDTIEDAPFRPECYTGSRAAPASYETQAAEAIVLQAVCHENRAAHSAGDTEFTTIYVDPHTHLPIAVVGGTHEHFVAVDLLERFSVADGHVVPSYFRVKINGSGPMFWLNVDAHQTYSDYHFMETLP